MRIYRILLVLIALAATSCVNHHHQCCSYGRTVRNAGPACREGDLGKKADRLAIIQPTAQSATLIVQLSPGHRKAIVLTDDQLDALECSIAYYRRIHGYAPRHPHPCRSYR